MTQAPANWYYDGSGRLRYWDGSAWTEHFADTYVPPAPTTAPVQPAGFGPAQPSAQPTDAWSQPHAAPSQGFDAPGSQPSVAPQADGSDSDFGYAAPGMVSAPATAYSADLDPFAAPPRQGAYSGATSPRKGLPGWGIALIVGGAVIIIGGVIGVAIMMSTFVTAANEVYEGVADDPYLVEPVPTEIQAAYDHLDAAYRAKSCSDLQAVTTPSYLESLGIDADNCLGAFPIEGERIGAYSELDYWYDEGDLGFLGAYEWYVQDGVDHSNTVEYTLVKVGDEWLFDSVYSFDY